MPIADLSQKQRESLVRLLIGATYGDGHISLIESETFDSMIDSLRWHSPMARSLFIDEATSAARQAFEDGSAEDFVVKHCATFDDDATRATALDLINHLLESDGLTIEEAGLLRIVMRELGELP
jgi:hypothetical protein